MLAQIGGQMVRGIAISLSVSDNDDAAAGCKGLGYTNIVAWVLRGLLPVLACLVLMPHMVQEVMWIVGLDDVLGCIRR